MWTVWTTSLVFAIALGGFFFKGPSWDHYAIGVLILALVVLVALLRDQAGTRTLRQVTNVQPRTVTGEPGGDEVAQRRITALQTRIGELRAGHSWCRSR